MTILNARGVPVKTPAAKPFREMGVSGTVLYSGYLRTVERNSDWIGPTKYITAAELATNVSIVAASVHHFLNLVSHPSWSVRPADSDDPRAQELAEFVELCMEDTFTPWSRIIRRAAMYRFHGFGIQEWTAKRNKDGTVGFRDIEPRPQFTIEQWEIDDDGSVLGVWQRSPQTGKLLGLPRKKLIYLVEDTLTDSPEGLGIFRHMAEPYKRFKQFLELEVRAYERDLRGIPVGRIPYTYIRRAVKDGELTEELAASLIEGMEDIVTTQVKQSNTGITLDSIPYEGQAADGVKPTGVPQWGLELLTGPALGLQEISAVIDRTQREMARIIGTEHLMMGDQGGNRALSADKSRNLYLIANAVLENIASSFEHDFLWPLWELNGLPDELMPSLETEDVAFKDVAQVTASLAQMAQAGAVLAPDDPVIGDVRALLGVSRPPEPDPDLMGLLEEEPALEEGTLADEPTSEDMEEMMSEDDPSDATTEQDEQVQMQVGKRGLELLIPLKRLNGHRRTYTNGHAR